MILITSNIVQIFLYLNTGTAFEGRFRC